MLQGFLLAHQVRAKGLKAAKPSALKSLTFLAATVNPCTFSVATLKAFPSSPQERDKTLEAAPGESRAPTLEEESAWSTGIVVKADGYMAVREAVATKRR